jgi:hypothetical protein
VEKLRLVTERRGVLSRMPRDTAHGNGAPHDDWDHMDMGDGIVMGVRMDM